jgi:hypothetical protein
MTGIRSSGFDLANLYKFKVEIGLFPKKYPRSKSVKAWGCPRGTPSLSSKIRSPFKTLYFYCFIFYAFFLECLYFCFHFYFALFVAINIGSHHVCFGGRYTLFFIAKNTLVFTLIVQRVFSFSATAFSFLFCLHFCSDFVISLYQGEFRPLVYVGFHQKSCLKKV